VAVTLLIVGTLPLLFVVGEDFLPTVDAGLMKLHVRAPTGTRIERTELITDDVERSIRRIIPANEIEGISDNIGLPISYDLAFYPTDNIGAQDAEILIQLSPGHRPTDLYEQRIRQMLHTDYPTVTGYFQAADIVNQVLNFGLPAIMAVGVGVANGNLLITFANDMREQGMGPVEAALEAGSIRFRPIIMTALAMILGMLPMALGSGSE